jgi:hypothetical protein
MNMRLLTAALIVTSCLALSAQTRTGTGAVLFEGARLITGNDGAPIDNSAFLVQNNQFVRVGR